MSFDDLNLGIGSVGDATAEGDARGGSAVTETTVIIVGAGPAG